MLQNSKLQNCFKLGSKVTVYVPSTVDIDIVVDTSEYVNRVATNLSNWFGGATSTEALGYWVSPTNGLIKEKSTMVFAYCNQTDLESHIDELVTMCDNVKNELKQDAVALEINGEMYFI